MDYKLKLLGLSEYLDGTYYGFKDLYEPIDSALLDEFNETRNSSARGKLCHAPFKNIYFGTGGRASACCLNREYLLGNYPHQSIKEIWFGKNVEKLREHIERNDLSLGCHTCKKQLKSKNFDGVQARVNDPYPSNKNGYPSTMEMELDNICNLECEMCFGEFSSLIRKNRENLPPLKSPYDEEFVNQLTEFIPHLSQMKFFGGEPFLIKLYYDIWDKIIEINSNVLIKLTTNGTILNNKIKDVLGRGRFGFSISIDSFEKETYEQIRKNAKYDTVMENIKYYRDYTKTNNTFFGISVCPMRLNWRELPAIVRRCNDLNAQVFFNTVWNPSHASISTLEPQMIKEIVDYLEAAELPSESSVEKGNILHYRDMISLISTWHTNAILRAKKRERLKTQIHSLGYQNTFYKEMEECVSNKERLSTEEKQELVEAYMSKMGKIINKLPDSYPLEEIFEQLLFKKPMEEVITNFLMYDETKILSEALEYARKL